MAAGFKWTKALETHLRDQQRRTAPCKKPGDTASEIYACVQRELVAGARPHIEEKLEGAPLEDLTRAALAAYAPAEPEEDRDLLVEAAALRLFSIYRGPSELLWFLVEQAGVDFALRAWVESTRFRLDSAEWHLVERRVSRPDHLLQRRADRVFHVALPAAPEAERQRARELAEEHREGGDLLHRSLFAAVFLDPDWIHHDLLEHLRTQQPVVATPEMVLASGPGEVVVRFLRDIDSLSVWHFVDAFEYRALERDPELLGHYLVGYLRHCTREHERLAAYVVANQVRPLAVGLKKVTGCLPLVEAWIALHEWRSHVQLSKREDPIRHALEGLQANAGVAVPLLEARLAADPGALWAVDLLEQLRS